MAMDINKDLKTKDIWDVDYLSTSDEEDNDTEDEQEEDDP